MRSLTNRFKTALDVSGAFDNCFFHTYAIHLLANKQALPDDLFDFESIGGSNSPASILQQQFKNDRSLSLFEKQHRYKHPDAPTPFFLVEKTLVLGILLREWFATKMFQKGNEVALKMLDENDYDVINSFKSYIEFREAGSEKQDLVTTQKGTIYKANEDFLEYIIQRKNPAFTEEQRKPQFENFLVGVDIETALGNFWLEVGCTNYCQYMAELHAQVTSADVAHVIEENLEQPLTIYDQDNTHLIYNNNGSITHPKMEIVLNVKEYHFKLLKTEQTASLLDEYDANYQQYKIDRERIIKHSRAEDIRAAAKEQPSIFVGAICKEEHLNTKPFNLLKAKVDELQTFVKKTEEAIALDEQRQAREAEPEQRRSPSPIQVIEANAVDNDEPVLAGIQSVETYKGQKLKRDGLKHNLLPPVERPEPIEFFEEEHSIKHDKDKKEPSPMPGVLDSSSGVIMPFVQPTENQPKPEKQVFPKITNLAHKKAEFNKCIDALEAQIENLKRRMVIEARRNTNSEDYLKLKAAYDATASIHRGIKDAGKKYFERRISYIDFKGLVKAAVNNEETRPTLEEHRGVKKVLEDIINFLPKLINSLFGTEITLFKLNTESINKIDAVADTVNKAGPGAS